MKIDARLLVGILLSLCWTQTASAQKLFSDLLGSTSIQPVADSKTVTMPFITWGGDVATFMANGDLTTQPSSEFAKLGLDVKLVPGDDFQQQVRDYLAGKSPFLRGTMRMLGQASQVIGQDPRTKPVVILQLSWSAGDHLVARQEIKTLNDLRGKGDKVKIACQQGGPHVGLLYDSLDAAKISREEVEIVWVDGLTGPNGPADAFRNDPSIAACCVITPDMLALTGGYDSTGSGAEGTVEGAHVLNSTRDMSRSIADVYAVRADWYQNHRDFVTKFVAGYLKETNRLVSLRRQFEENQQLSKKYRDVLTLAQKILGNEVINTLEIDGHGLLLDCGFVGLPGQVAFFEDRGNLSGFDAKMKSSLDLATGWGYATFRSGFEPASLDYPTIAKTANITYERPAAQSSIEINEGGIFPDSENLDHQTIVSFTIKFDPNRPDFSADRYGAEFNRAIQAASTFGNAVIVIRGHADPTKALLDMIRGGMEKRMITRSGSQGKFRYYVNGKPLDLTQTKRVIELIKSGAFDTSTHKARDTVQAALNLSMARAESVKSSLIGFAKLQNVNLDASQLQPTGAGISEPVIPKPKNFDEALENMRVEFRIVRVPAEALNESDFAF